MTVNTCTQTWSFYKSKKRKHLEQPAFTFPISSCLYLVSDLKYTLGMFVHFSFLMKWFFWEPVRNAGFPGCLAWINVTFQRVLTQGRPGEIMATKASFSRIQPFPHADLNLPPPLFCFLAATQTFSLHLCFTGSRNVCLVRESTLQGENMGLRVGKANLQRLWVLKTNEIW